ncbi:DEMETER-like protein 2 [Panicum miliaceum]|uniref:DEMETER-like protein 2 n=1 Tax=Panicum miliaceum TaxID=4540 RepID=A0A3L6TNE1_PANMI|nr:DEMETER-like protein 2 [Panicum miliaceum]
MATDLPSADDGGTPAASGMPPELTPPSTWRKKPSQKGNPRLRLVKHAVARTATPKRPVAPQQKRSRTKAGDGVVGESRPKPVRGKLDLDGELGSTKIGAPAAVSGNFRRATLMDSLRSLAKLALTDKPPAAPPKIDNPPRMPPASPPKIVLRSFGQFQLMENLRSLAKRHNLPAAAAAVTADEAQDAKGKSRAKKPTMVDELVLVPYSRKRAAAAAAEDPFHMAVVVHGGPGPGAGTTLVPRWTAVELARTRTRGRLVRGITPAIEAAYSQLMRLEETCRGEDLPDIPESPQLEEKRRDLEVRVKHFMNHARLIMGDRKFDDPWKGTVVTSIVGTFLTQNVTDQMSSNASMNLAAKFSLPKNGSNEVEQRSTNAPLAITDGRDLGDSEPVDAGSDGEVGNRRDEGIEELIASLRTGEVSSSGKERIRKVLRDRFEHSTAAKIYSDIASVRDTSHWNSLLKEAYGNGYRKEDTGCIRDRGNQSQMALRILAFLIRIKRDHGSIDLEWLRYVPRAKAKRYPVMSDIQKYLEPLLCKIPAEEVYELHCQQITFGKSICTKRRPNCGACPFTTECKYFQSQVSRYEIPDGHEILDKFDPRVPGYCNVYLLIIRSRLDEHSVTATILIPCRTANRGVFPLDGTYYQHNKVFADHSSSRSPIEIKTESIWAFKQCTVYFGTSIHSVTRGYICNREFDRRTRRPKVLSGQIHATNAKGSGRKKSKTNSSLSPGEGNDRGGAQSS